MSNREVIFLLVCSFILSMFLACDKSSDPVSSNNDSTKNDKDYETTVTEALAENCGNHEDADDYSWDSSDVIQIVLNGNTITVNGTGATVNGSKVTITSAGTYSISGSLSNGQVIVNTDDKDIVRLILSGVDINCSTSAPIYIKNAEKTIIILADNTVNHITDGSSYIYDDSEAEEPNAAIFSNDDLTIYGNGSLTVDGNFNDGIASKDGLIIASGTIAIDAVDDGIRGKDYLMIKNGNITVNAKGDGLKSDEDEDTTKGYLLIEDGTIGITAGGDAITAVTDVLITGGDINLSSGGGSNKTVSGTASAKGIKADVTLIIDGGTINVNSADDGIHSNGSISINDGTIYVATGDDGIKSEVSTTISTATVSISKSYEGIESPSITVNSGNISIVATDDGFNATYGFGGEPNDGSCLYIYGGNIVVNTSRGDALDSNGNIVITSGRIIVHGPQSQPEVGMDCNGTCKISGGFLVISGTNSNMTEGPSTSSSQYSVIFMSRSKLSTATLFHIEDAEGNNIVTYQPVRSYYSIIFSSPDLKKGSTYYIYEGGTSTGTVTDGLYEGGTYIPGTKYASFTISSIVTNIK